MCVNTHIASASFMCCVLLNIHELESFVLEKLAGDGHPDNQHDLVKHTLRIVENAE